LPLCVCFLLVSVSFCVSIYLRHHPRDNCLGPCRFRGTALRDGHRRVRIGAQKVHTLCCSIVLLAVGLKPVAANDHSFFTYETKYSFTHSNVTQKLGLFSAHCAHKRIRAPPRSIVSSRAAHQRTLATTARRRLKMHTAASARPASAVRFFFSSFSSAFWVGLS